LGRALIKISLGVVPAMVGMFGHFVAVVDLEGKEFVSTGDCVQVFGGL